MPAKGRRGFVKSNIVDELPSLPVPIILGKLSVSKSFNNHPTGSIEYEAIHKNDVSTYESAYNPRRSSGKINIAGIPFRVREDGGYSYERQQYIFKEDTIIEAFKVKIELDGWWKELCEKKIKVRKLVTAGSKKVSVNRIASAAKVSYSGPSFTVPVDNLDETIALGDILNEHALIQGCYMNYSGSSVKMVRLDSSSAWSFGYEQIIEDGSNVLGLPPYYNESELTWENNVEEEKFYLIDPQPRFQQKEPVIKTEVEEDEDIQLPPKNTEVLRDLSSNHDQSRPKKSAKPQQQLTVNLTQKKTEIWGFAYYWEDQDDPEKDFIISQPDKFWVQVEEENRKFIYDSISPPSVSISTKDPTGQQAKLVIHPDYLDYVTISLGLESTITTSPNVDYLTGVSTSGWTLTRPSPEPAEDGSTTLDGPPPDGSPFYPLMKFRKIPKADAIKYYLVPARNDYGEQGAGKSFEIEWTDWLSLDPTLRARIMNQGGNIQDGVIGAENNRIGLIKPDLNYVEPLLVWVESRQGSSFASFPHPENDPKNGNPKQPIICGEESYYQDIWTKIDEDRSREKIVSFSAQDYGFSSLKEEVKYRRIIGKPPEAQYKQRTWEEVSDTAGNPTVSSTEAFKTRYFLFSDDIPVGASVTGDVSFPLAKTLVEATKAAKTQLRLDGIQGNTTKNATVSWYYPQIDEGDIINFERDRFSRYGKWRVLSCSWTLDYKGVNQNKYGVEATCSGTQLSCGMDESRSVRIVTRKEPIAANPDSQNQGKEPNVESQTTRSVASLGSILESAPGRRMN